MQRRIALVLVLLLAGVAGASPPGDEGEWEREAGPEVVFTSPRDAQGNATHVVVRIVDAITGAGLPGASVALHSQDEYPVTGLVPADRTGLADADGWVRIRAQDSDAEPTWVGSYWLYVEAPGHAGAVLHPGTGTDGEELGLLRARDAVVEVRDALDRPLGGAVVGVRDSATCGHMNDQRVAVTGFDGRAVIRGLCAETQADANDGWECWVVGDRIASDYHDLAVPAWPAPPQVLRHLPSHPITGVILDANGGPLAGVHVGGGSAHRGPWALTDGAGRFRLVGADPTGRVEVVQEHEGMYAEGHPPFPSFEPPPPGVPRVLRLPPPGTAMSKEERVGVDVSVRDAGSGAALERVPLVAWRDGDGWTTRAWGEIVDLPRGTFTVEAGGGLSPYAPARARLEVGAAPPPPLVLEVTRHPGVRVVLEDDPGAVLLALVSADDVREEGVLQEAQAGVVAVPPDVECAFRVAVGERSGEHVEFVPIPLHARGPGAPPIHLHATRTAVVRARLAGPDGAVVPGWLVPDARQVLQTWYDAWEPATPATRAPSASLHDAGRVELLAVPEARSLRPRIVAVDVPAGAGGGAPVDLGTVQLEERGDRRLRFLDASGAPADPGFVTVAHEGVVHDLAPGEDGTYDPRLLPLAAGDVVIAPSQALEEDAWSRTVRWTLAGPGPWTLRLDAQGASLVIDAQDEDGRPLDDAVVVVDGQACTGLAPTDEDGPPRPLALRGLAPGPHRIAVAAADRLTRLYRVILQPAEERRITARLRTRPSR